MGSPRFREAIERAMVLPPVFVVNTPVSPQGQAPEVERSAFARLGAREHEAAPGIPGVGRQIGRTFGEELCLATAPAVRDDVGEEETALPAGLAADGVDRGLAIQAVANVGR